MLKSLYMQDLLVLTKSFLVVTFVWLFDVNFLSKILLNIDFVTSDYKLFLENSRELINLLVSCLILLITAIKFARVYQNKDKKS